MASYTRIEVIADCEHMCTDGLGNLYVYSDDGTDTTIYQYVIATDTLIDISGATFNGHSSGSGSNGNAEWWTYNNTLYCVTGIWASNDVFVHKWNGGQSWTTVFTEDWSGVLTLNPILAGDGTRLAVLYGSTAHARSFELWATTDGTAWNSQSYDGTHAWALYWDRSQRNELVIRRYKAAGPDYRMFAHSAGNAWAAISGGSIGTIQFLGTEDTYQFFRSGGSALYRSTNWGVAIDVIAGAWAFAEEASVVNLTHEVVGALGNSNDDVSFWNAGTVTFDIDGTPSGGSRVKRQPCYHNGFLYVLVDEDGIYVRDDPIGPVSAYSIGTASGSDPTAMSVSPDDFYVHIGVLDGSSNPVLLRLLADLTANPTKVYDPGAGSAIGVQCGDLNEEWVWIAGDFGGAIKVRVSLDDGTTWITKDPGGWNGVALPLIVGPDDDNLVLVPTDGDDDLFETEDGGLNWATLNDTLPYDIGGMDRLYWYLDEIVIGTDVAGASRIHYSPNNGATLHDITAGTPNVAINDLVIG